MRKLTVILLSVAIALLGLTTISVAKDPQAYCWSTLQEYEKATGNKIEKFNEAPMLKTKVATGELPPVEERLPEEPLVIEPYEEIGQYGGRLHVFSVGPTFSDITHPRMVGLIEETNEGKPYANIAKGWDVSEDKTTYTIYLRKGTKWSDGMPFTADDIVFWYEDVLQNKELTPTISGWWKADGKLMDLEKIDDYTVRIRFAKPRAWFINLLQYWGTMWWAFGNGTPKHYLKKWHIKYNPKANELAKEEDFEYWWQAFNQHRNVGDFTQQDLNTPCLSPWVLKEITPDYRLFERNPYFWGVDPEGNQLPYIDEVLCQIVSDIEVYNMKVATGQADIACMYLTLENYPFYKANEEKGNYRVYLWKNPRGSDEAFCFNLNHKDPVLRKIFQDVRFRRAMSLAIDREDVNDSVFFGRGVVRQAAPNPDTSYYKEEWGKAYVEYDPEKANQLLDEMGLKWDKDHQYRLRPDGKTLTITIDVTKTDSPTESVAELVKEYWEKVGVKTEVNMRERSFYQTRLAAAEHDVCVWHVDRTNEVRAYVPRMNKLLQEAYAEFGLAYAPKWAQWNVTDGKEGEEPPEDWKRFYKLVDEWFAATSHEEYVQLAQQIFDFLILKKLVVIGTVAFTPYPVIIKNTLGNFPEKAWTTDDVGFFRSIKPPQWFFKK